MELPYVGDAVNFFVSGFPSISATLIVFAISIGLVAVVVIYIIDVTQTKLAIRRVVLCLRWAVSRRCNATRTLAPPVSARMIRNYNLASISPTRRNRLPVSRIRSSTRSALPRIPAACMNRASCAVFTVASLWTMAVRCRRTNSTWTRFRPKQTRLIRLQPKPLRPEELI